MGYMTLNDQDMLPHVLFLMTLNPVSECVLHTKLDNYSFRRIPVDHAESLKIRFSQIKGRSLPILYHN